MQKVIDAYLEDTKSKWDQSIFAFRLVPVASTSLSEYTRWAHEVMGNRMEQNDKELSPNEKCEIVRVDPEVILAYLDAENKESWPYCGIIQLYEGKMMQSIYLSSLEMNHLSFVFGNYHYASKFKVGNAIPSISSITFDDRNDIRVSVCWEGELAHEENKYDGKLTLVKCGDANSTYAVTADKEGYHVNISGIGRLVEYFDSKTQGCTHSFEAHFSPTESSVPICKAQFDEALRKRDPLYPHMGLWPLATQWKYYIRLYAPMAVSSISKFIDWLKGKTTVPANSDN
jgi:hypothetical protein